MWDACVHAHVCVSVYMHVCIRQFVIESKTWILFFVEWYVPSISPVGYSIDDPLRSAGCTPVRQLGSTSLWNTQLIEDVETKEEGARPLESRDSLDPGAKGPHHLGATSSQWHLCATGNTGHWASSSDRPNVLGLSWVLHFLVSPSLSTEAPWFSCSAPTSKLSCF